MGKYKYILMILFYFVIITIVAESLFIQVIGGNTIGAVAPSFSLDYFFYLTGVFIGLFFFGIDGFPPVLSIIFFWLPSITLVIFVATGGKD